MKYFEITKPVAQVAFNKGEITLFSKIVTHSNILGK